MSDRRDSRVDVRCRRLGEMKSTELPYVDCAALLGLKHLLLAATGSSERDVVQTQHHSGSAGGADAEALAVPTPSERVVFSTRGNPRVTCRGAAEDDSPTGQDAERTLAAPLSLATILYGATHEPRPPIMVR